jgi:hypothetical protein
VERKEKTSEKRREEISGFGRVHTDRSFFHAFVCAAAATAAAMQKGSASPSVRATEALSTVNPGELIPPDGVSMEALEVRLEELGDVRSREAVCKALHSRTVGL